jgi:hypothetical protein
MKPTLFLRIASVLTIVHAILHTIGGVFSKPDLGAAAVAFSAMQSNHFMVMGLSRSYADFYRGMGLGATISLTIEGIVFWQLGSLAISQGERLRPVLASFCVAYLALAVNSSFYFFQAPVIVEILIAVLLGLAFVTAKPARAA